MQNTSTWASSVKRPCLWHVYKVGKVAAIAICQSKWSTTIRKKNFCGFPCCQLNENSRVSKRIRNIAGTNEYSLGCGYPQTFLRQKRKKKSHLRERCKWGREEDMAAGGLVGKTCIRIELGGKNKEVVLRKCILAPPLCAAFYVRDRVCVQQRQKEIWHVEKELWIQSAMRPWRIIKVPSVLSLRRFSRGPCSSSSSSSLLAPIPFPLSLISEGHLKPPDSAHAHAKQRQQCFSDA